MAAVFWAQMAPRVPSPPEGITDKHEHVFFYGILGALALRAFSNAAWSRVTMRTSMAAVVFAAGYGVTLEFCQRLVPNRSYEVLDMIADAVGAAAAVAAVFVWSIIRHRSETSDVL
jgi:VanZ family protein